MRRLMEFVLLSPHRLIFMDCFNNRMSEEDLLKGADLGVEQIIAASGAKGQRTLANIVEAREYLATVVIDQSLKNLCKNQHAQCSFWATLGECESKFEQRKPTALILLLVTYVYFG